MSIQTRYNENCLGNQNNLNNKILNNESADIQFAKERSKLVKPSANTKRATALMALVRKNVHELTPTDLNG